MLSENKKALDDLQKSLLQTTTEGSKILETKPDSDKTMEKTMDKTGDEKKAVD